MEIHRLVYKWYTAEPWLDFFEIQVDAMGFISI